MIGNTIMGTQTNAPTIASPLRCARLWLPSAMAFSKLAISLNNSPWPIINSKPNSTIKTVKKTISALLATLSHYIDFLFYIYMLCARYTLEPFLLLFLLFVILLFSLNDYQNIISSSLPTLFRESYVKFAWRSFLIFFFYRQVRASHSASATIQWGYSLHKPETQQKIVR